MDRKARPGVLFGPSTLACGALSAAGPVTAGEYKDALGMLPVYVDGVSSPDSQDYRDLARNLVRLLEIARRTLVDEDVLSELAARVTGHLGCGLSDVVAVHERFRIWDQVNVYRGVEAYLGRHDTSGTWFGSPTGMMRPGQGLLSRLAMPAPGSMGKAGNATYGTVATGPDTSTEVVTLGMIATTAPGGAPVLIGIRTEQELGAAQGSLEIMAADRDTASATRDEIGRLSAEHNVFRGQVLSFAQSEHHGNELVSFLPRIPLTAADVVLPDGVLESIEGHVAGIGRLSGELRGVGQHLKRGLLLYGPPGTGKTHTVRYLTGKLTGTTVILLTGRSVRFVESAAALARRLQPSMVVLEDVDLIAMDRDVADRSNPLLFTLLDAMDGVGSDADVTFVLTTNRADILEHALADRPGRVDLAIEIPRPDAVSRERLLRLYTRDVALDGGVSAVVAATEGVTASFIKELVRRAVLAALRAAERPLVVRQAHFDEVLAEMNAERQSLTRSLLGGDAGAADARPLGTFRRARRQ
jgi:hypothetical protein